MLIKKEQKVVHAYDYGLASLKICMCFIVVLCHFWRIPDSPPIYLKPIIFIRGLAVPLFTIMSFYLCKKLFTEFDDRGGIFKKRIWRLIYPLWAWGILYFLFFTFVQFLTKIDLSVSINDLLWQLALGSSPVINPPLWYQVDLIIITTIFYCILRLFPKDKGLVCIWIIAAIALILQYSGINASLFGRFKYEIEFTTGRIVEMIPFATIGYSLAVTHYIDELKKKRLVSSITIIYLTILLVRYNILGGTTPGFGYGGMCYIVVGTLIFLLAIVIPFENLPEIFKRLIRVISKFTFGIFCIHYGVGRCLNFLISELELQINTFFECIVIFVISYIACGVIWLIPCKYAKQLVE